jgi:hypothetical protein
MFEMKQMRIGRWERKDKEVPSMLGSTLGT